MKFSVCHFSSWTCISCGDPSPCKMVMTPGIGFSLRNFIYSSTSWQSSRYSAGCAILMSPVPRTTIAFTPLSPITAPNSLSAGTGSALLDGSKIDPVFTGQADSSHLGFGLLQLLPNKFCSFSGAFTLQMGCISYFYLVIVDPQINQIGGLAAQDHFVITGILQFRCPKSPHH